VTSLREYGILHSAAFESISFARPMGDDDKSPERQNYIFCGSALIKTKAGATVNKYEK
jgi:hypothetical protein